MLLPEYRYGVLGEPGRKCSRRRWELVSTRLRNISHIKDMDVLVECFFVRIFQIRPGIAFRRGILKNFFPRRVDALLGIKHNIFKRRGCRVFFVYVIDPWLSFRYQR